MKDKKKYLKRILCVETKTAPVLSDMSWPRVKRLEVYNNIFHHHMGNGMWIYFCVCHFTSLPDNKYVRIYAMRSAKCQQKMWCIQLNILYLDYI